MQFGVKRLDFAKRGLAECILNSPLCFIFVGGGVIGVPTDETYEEDKECLSLEYGLPDERRHQPRLFHVSRQLLLLSVEHLECCVPFVGVHPTSSSVHIPLPLSHFRLWNVRAACWLGVDIPEFELEQELPCSEDLVLCGKDGYSCLSCSYCCLSSFCGSHGYCNAISLL
ncbi:uncharacterized protein G2W53_030606 [Senna tora]|uniref:Uncharacterized protein n=1 Tax=Senna tora TaxID=362788 RepID=A0A834WBR8_9FABA|nr:uncharacterized protein G2W53_030606 [Senna tora]